MWNIYVMKISVTILENIYFWKKFVRFYMYYILKFMDYGRCKKKTKILNNLRIARFKKILNQGELFLVTEYFRNKKNFKRIAYHNEYFSLSFVFRNVGGYKARFLLFNSILSFSLSLSLSLSHSRIIIAHCISMRRKNS